MHARDGSTMGRGPLHPVEHHELYEELVDGLQELGWTLLPCEDAAGDSHCEVVLAPDYAEDMTPDDECFRPLVRYKSYSNALKEVGLDIETLDKNYYIANFVHKVLYHQLHAHWIDIAHELGHVLQVEYIARVRATDVGTFDEDDETQRPIDYLATHWYPPYRATKEEWNLKSPPDGTEKLEPPQEPEQSIWWTAKNLTEFLVVPVAYLTKADDHYLEFHNYMMEFVRLAETPDIDPRALVNVAAKVRHHREAVSRTFASNDVRRGCDALWPISDLQRAYFASLEAAEGSVMLPSSNCSKCGRVHLELQNVIYPPRQVRCDECCPDEEDDRPDAYSDDSERERKRSDEDSDYSE